MRYSKEKLRSVLLPSEIDEWEEVECETGESAQHLRWEIDDLQQELDDLEGKLDRVEAFEDSDLTRLLVARLDAEQELRENADRVFVAMGAL